MLGIFLFIIAANGFIILRFSPYQFYKLHRYEGQLLYIKAVCLGLIAVGISFLFDSYFGIVNYLCKLFPKTGMIFDTERLPEYSVFFLLSMCVSASYCVLQRSWSLLKVRWQFRGVENRQSYRELANILLMRSVLNDSPLDRLLFRSYVHVQEDIFLLITMSDRKVYVGRVINLGEPNEKQGPGQEISIIPVFSGYRDKDTLAVTLNHRYANEDSAKDVYVVLKQDNIVSACEFVESLYEGFQR